MDWAAYLVRQVGASNPDRFFNALVLTRGLCELRSSRPELFMGSILLLDEIRNVLFDRCDPQHMAETRDRFAGSS